MSLYANISVSSRQKKTQDAPLRDTVPLAKKQTKSAALYAGVLAKPPSPALVETKQQTTVTNVVTQQSVVEVEPTTEKPSEIAALQFKPALKRLQKTVKTKTISLAPPPPEPTDSNAATPSSAPGSSKPFLQDVTKIQEDIANDDVNGYYRTLEGQKLARKAAKKRKRSQAQGTYVWTWDDDYDPLHPNEYESYIDSDEHLQEQIEWQNKLEGKDESEDTDYRGFAPLGEDDEDDWAPPEDDGHDFVPEPVAEISLDETPDEVYARRMRLAQQAGKNIRPPTPPSAVETPKEEENIEEEMNKEPQLEASEPSEPIPNFYDDEPAAPILPPPMQPPPSQPLFNFSTYNQPPSLYASAPGMQPSQPYLPPPSTTISSEPVHYASATVSSEPVHYSTTTIEPTPDQPRSNLPGQKGFAARYMSKHGWEKGQSLGATPQTGLVTPLMMKVDKEKKGTGIIINRNKAVEDHGPFGKMSRCIVLANVVAPGEVDDDLIDEIGEECRSKYGEVERVKVFEDRKRPEDEAVRVFVLFTSELSALRGVNSLDGRLFGGRKIKARFYDVDKFEDGDFR